MAKKYNLLYKVGYNPKGYAKPMYKYERYSITASSLTEAKRLLKKRHPKATKFQYVEQL